MLVDGASRAHLEDEDAATAQADTGDEEVLVPRYGCLPLPQLVEGETTPDHSQAQQQGRVELHAHEGERSYGPVTLWPTCCRPQGSAAGDQAAVERVLGALQALPKARCRAWRPKNASLYSPHYFDFSTGS